MSEQSLRMREPRARELATLHPKSLVLEIDETLQENSDKFWGWSLCSRGCNTRVYVSVTEAKAIPFKELLKSQMLAPKSGYSGGREDHESSKI